MADQGAVLKFPGGKSETPLPVNKAPTLPKLGSYDYEETVSLHQIGTSVKKKAEDLVLFVDQNRAVARQAGIETLALQLNSILEGDKFQRVMDSLEDAVYRHTPVSLTNEGIDRIHRMEGLIADADQVIVNFMNGKKIDQAIEPAPVRHQPMMGQMQTPYQPIPYPIYPPHSGSSDSTTWMPLVIIAVAGIVGVIAIIALSQQPRKV